MLTPRDGTIGAVWLAVRAAAAAADALDVDLAAVHATLPATDPALDRSGGRDATETPATAGTAGTGAADA